MAFDYARIAAGLQAISQPANVSVGGESRAGQKAFNKYGKAEAARRRAEAKRRDANKGGLFGGLGGLGPLGGAVGKGIDVLTGIGTALPAKLSQVGTELFDEGDLLGAGKAILETPQTAALQGASIAAGLVGAEGVEEDLANAAFGGNRAYAKDYLDRTMVGTYYQRALNKRGLDDTPLGNQWVKRGVGLAGDIGLDPLTYLSGAKALQAPEQVATALLKEGSKTLGDDAARAAAAKVLRSGAGALTKEELASIGQRGGLYFGIGRAQIPVPFTAAGKTTTLTSRLNRPLRAVREVGGDAIDKLGIRPGATAALKKLQRLGPDEARKATDAFVFRQAELTHRTVRKGIANEFVRDLDNQFEAIAKQSGRELDDNFLDDLGRALEGDTEAMARTGGAEQGLRAWLDNLHQKAVEAGVDIPRLDDYLPRQITDAFRDTIRKKGRGVQLSPTRVTEAFAQRRKLVAGETFMGKTLTGDTPAAVRKEIETIFQEALGEGDTVYKTGLHAILGTYADQVGSAIAKKQAADYMLEMGAAEPAFVERIVDVIAKANRPAAKAARKGARRAAKDAARAAGRVTEIDDELDAVLSRLREASGAPLRRIKRGHANYYANRADELEARFAELQATNRGWRKTEADVIELRTQLLDELAEARASLDAAERNLQYLARQGDAMPEREAALAEARATLDRAEKAATQRVAKAARARSRVGGLETAARRAETQVVLLDDAVKDARQAVEVAQRGLDEATGVIDPERARLIDQRLAEMTEEEIAVYRQLKEEFLAANPEADGSMLDATILDAMRRTMRRNGGRLDQGVYRNVDEVVPTGARVDVDLDRALTAEELRQMTPEQRSAYDAALNESATAERAAERRGASDATSPGVGDASPYGSGRAGKVKPITQRTVSRRELVDPYAYDISEGMGGTIAWMEARAQELLGERRLATREEVILAANEGRGAGEVARSAQQLSERELVGEVDRANAALRVKYPERATIFEESAADDPDFLEALLKDASTPKETRKAIAAQLRARRGRRVGTVLDTSRTQGGEAARRADEIAQNVARIPREGVDPDEVALIRSRIDEAEEDLVQIRALAAMAEGNSIHTMSRGLAENLSARNRQWADKYGQAVIVQVPDAEGRVVIQFDPSVVETARNQLRARLDGMSEPKYKTVDEWALDSRRRLQATRRGYVNADDFAPNNANVSHVFNDDVPIEQLRADEKAARELAVRAQFNQMNRAKLLADDPSAAQVGGSVEPRKSTARWEEAAGAAPQAAVDPQLAAARFESISKYTGKKVSTVEEAEAAVEELRERLLRMGDEAEAMQGEANRTQEFSELFAQRSKMNDLSRKIDRSERELRRLDEAARVGAPVEPPTVYRVMDDATGEILEVPDAKAAQKWVDERNGTTLVKDESGDYAYVSGDGRYAVGRAVKGGKQARTDHYWVEHAGLEAGQQEGPFRTLKEAQDWIREDAAENARVPLGQAEEIAQPGRASARTIRQVDEGIAEQTRVATNGLFDDPNEWLKFVREAIPAAEERAAARQAVVDAAKGELDAARAEFGRVTATYGHASRRAAAARERVDRAIGILRRYGKDPTKTPKRLVAQAADEVNQELDRLEFSRHLRSSVRETAADAASRNAQRVRDLEDELATLPAEGERAQLLGQAKEMRAKADELLAEANGEVDDLTRQVQTLGAEKLMREAELLQAQQREITNRQLFDAMREQRTVRVVEAHLKEQLEKGLKGLIDDNPGLAADADVIEAYRAVKKAFEPKQLNKFMETVYKPVYNLMKGYLIGSTGFVNRNLMGGLYLNFLADVSTESYAKTIKLWRAYNAHLKGDSARWLAMPEAERAMFEGVSRGVGKGLTGFEFHQSQRIGRGIAFSDVNPLSSENAYLRTIRSYNQFVERFLRMSAGMDTMLQGGSLQNALDNIRKFHFDYEDLNQFERNVVKNVVPFYTWIRNNLPLQIEQSIKHPGKLMIYNKFKTNLELGTEEEYTPPYFRDIGAMRTPFSTDSGRVYLSAELPTNDLLFPKDEPGDWLSMVNPMIKNPVEAVLGKQAFKGIELGDAYEPSRFANVPGLMPVLAAFGAAEMRDDGNWYMAPKVAHVMEGYMPLLGRVRQLSPSTPNDERKQTTAWASFALGLGIRTNSDDEKMIGRISELYDEAESLINSGDDRARRRGYKIRAKANALVKKYKARQERELARG